MTRAAQATKAYLLLNRALEALNNYDHFHVQGLDTYLALGTTASVRAARNRQASVVRALSQDPAPCSRTCPVSGA